MEDGRWKMEGIDKSWEMESMAGWLTGWLVDLPLALESIGHCVMDWCMGKVGECCGLGLVV